MLYPIADLLTASTEYGKECQHIQSVHDAEEMFALFDIWEKSKDGVCLYCSDEKTFSFVIALYVSKTFRLTFVETVRYCNQVYPPFCLTGESVLRLIGHCHERWLERCSSRDGKEE